MIRVCLCRPPVLGLRCTTGASAPRAANVSDKSTKSCTLLGRLRVNPSMLQLYGNHGLGRRHMHGGVGSVASKARRGKGNSSADKNANAHNYGDNNINNTHMNEILRSPAMKQVMADLNHSLSQSSRKHASYRLVHYALSRCGPQNTAPNSTATAHKSGNNSNSSAIALTAEEQAVLVCSIWKLLQVLQRVHDASVASQAAALHQQGALHPQPQSNGSTTAERAECASTTVQKTAEKKDEHSGVMTADSLPSLVLPASFYDAHTRPIHTPNAIRLVQHISYMLAVQHDSHVLGTGEGSALEGEVDVNSEGPWTLPLLASLYVDTASFIVHLNKLNSHNISNRNSSSHAGSLLGRNADKASADVSSEVGEETVDGVPRPPVGQSTAVMVCLRLLDQVADRISLHVAEQHAMPTDALADLALEVLEAMVVSKSTQPALLDACIRWLRAVPSGQNPHLAARAVYLLGSLLQTVSPARLDSAALQVTNFVSLDALLEHVRPSSIPSAEAILNVRSDLMHMHSRDALPSILDEIDVIGHGSPHNIQASILDGISGLAALSAEDIAALSPSLQSDLFLGVSSAMLCAASDIYKLFHGEPLDAPSTSSIFQTCIETTLRWMDVVGMPIQEATFCHLAWSVLFPLVRCSLVPVSTQVALVSATVHALSRSTAARALDEQDAVTANKLANMATAFHRSKLPWITADNSGGACLSQVAILSRPSDNVEASPGGGFVCQLVATVLCTLPPSSKDWKLLFTQLDEQATHGEALAPHASSVPILARFLANDVRVGLRSRDARSRCTAADGLHAAANEFIAHMMLGNTSCHDEYSMLQTCLNAGLPHRGIFAALARRLAQSAAVTGYTLLDAPQLISAAYSFASTWTFDKEAFAMLLHNMQRHGASQTAVIRTLPAAQHSSLSGIVSKVMNVFDAPHLDFAVTPDPSWSRGLTDGAFQLTHHQPPNASADWLKVDAIRYALKNFSSFSRMAEHLPSSPSGRLEGGPSAGVPADDMTLQAWQPEWDTFKVHVEACAELLKGLVAGDGPNSVRGAQASYIADWQAKNMTSVQELRAAAGIGEGRHASSHASPITFRRLNHGLWLPLSIGNLAFEFVHPSDCVTLPSSVRRTLRIDGRIPSLLLLWRTALLLRDGWRVQYVPYPPLAAALHEVGIGSTNSGPDDLACSDMASCRDVLSCSGVLSRCDVSRVLQLLTDMSIARHKILNMSP